MNEWGGLGTVARPQTTHHMEQSETSHETAKSFPMPSAQSSSSSLTVDASGGGGGGAKMSRTHTLGTDAVGDAM